ncbi:LysE family translocator [Streptomyces marincola]|uniref:LysE family translocator n=1 Tax=Streptomyces marincola TaxID=2878388 RepID=UPI001CF5F198|nr:LysE family translocator [Streptomyces marincola]UCM89967.1 LysE family translocator [Streptomyces marincola]
MSVEFLITAFIIVVSPGTGAVYTVGTGLTRGFRMSVVAAFGCTLGIVPHLAAAIAGLAAILHTSALAFESFKWAGVIYLLFLAWQTLREKGAMKIETEGGSQAEERSVVRVIWTAVLLNFLNPKLSMFFLAFLPQFVPADSGNSLPHMLVLSAAFMIMTFVVFVIYGAFAAAVRDHVITRPKVLAWMRRTFAVAFVGLGVQLALASR